MNHLDELLRDYDAILHLLETSGLPMDNIKVLDSERMLLHDSIIAEVQRLGHTVRNREEGLWIARQIV